MLLEAILALSASLSTLALLDLWVRRKGPLRSKLFWSAAVWLPFLGPMFYAALYEGSSYSSENSRTPEHQDIYALPSTYLDNHNGSDEQ